MKTLSMKVTIKKKKPKKNKNKNKKHNLHEIPYMQQSTTTDDAYSQ